MCSLIQIKFIAVSPVMILLAFHEIKMLQHLITHTDILFKTDSNQNDNSDNLSISNYESDYTVHGHPLHIHAAAYWNSSSY